MATDAAAQAARDKWEQFKLWLIAQISDRMGDLSGDKIRLKVVGAGFEKAPPVETPAPSVAEEKVVAPAEPRAVTNGAPEPAPRAPRRRRVARSVTAPATDNASAVFVLPTAEHAPAPAVDYTADVPVVVPERRQRRRAVGRPAGPPPEES